MAVAVFASPVKNGWVWRPDDGVWIRDNLKATPRWKTDYHKWAARKAMQAQVYPNLLEDLGLNP